MATANEFKKLVSRVDGVEGQAQSLKEDMSSLITKMQIHETTSKAAQDDFIARTNEVVQQLTVDVPASVNTGIIASIDSVKARIVEELKDYIDRRIAEVTASIMFEVSALKTTVEDLKDS